ncbi:MAG: tetratricopeptide repeat protein [bacterium]|nr:tetratricopeptide repeat protein [bacterium]
MKIPRFLLLITFSSLTILMVGCGRVKVEEDLSADEEWKVAKTFFEYEKYLDAIDVLTNFTLNYSGSTLIDSAQFLLGESHFAVGEYILAASEYRRLVQNLPQSPLVDDAYLKIILCDFYLSPRFELDQKYTKETLSALQDFQDQFKSTDATILLRSKATTPDVLKEIFTLGMWRVDRPSVKDAPLDRTKVVFPHRSIGFGNWMLRVFTFGIFRPAEPDLIVPKSELVTGDWVIQRALDESRSKLAKKDFKTADLYYRTKKYPSAVIYLDTVVELYPETTWASRALKLKGDCQFAMRQYDDAAQSYQRYLDSKEAPDRKSIESRIEDCKRRAQLSTSKSTAAEQESPQP